MMSNNDDEVTLAGSDRWRAEIEVLRPLLRGCGLSEEIKWGKPCYCLDGANIVVIQEFSDHLALMFFKGLLLSDPDGILHDQGPNSHAAKRIRFTSLDDVAALSDVVADYVREAVAHEQAGTALPPRPADVLAPELVERLASDDHLAGAFEGLTPGRQREYNLYVAAAKQSSTRERRVDTIVPRIKSGKGLRDR